MKLPKSEVEKKRQLHKSPEAARGLYSRKKQRPLPREEMFEKPSCGRLDSQRYCAVRTPPPDTAISRLDIRTLAPEYHAMVIRALKANGHDSTEYEQG